MAPEEVYEEILTSLVIAGSDHFAASRENGTLEMLCPDGSEYIITVTKKNS